MGDRMTDKELAVGTLYELLTKTAIDADDIIAFHDNHAPDTVTLTEARAEKIAKKANELLLKAVEVRFQGYLDGRGFDTSSSTPLRRAVLAE